MEQHRCQIPECPRQIPLERLMCVRHWYMVSRMTRQRIWETYRKGQERDLTMVTPEYIGAMKLAVGEVQRAEAQTSGAPGGSSSTP